MLARVDLASKISLEEFRKQFGKHYNSEAKLKKGYEAAIAKFPKEESVKAVKEEKAK